MTRYIRVKDDRKNWVDLKIVTCNLPKLDLKYIAKVLEMGIIPSRSEYVRVAVRNQINRDLENIRLEEDIVKGEISLDPEKFIRIPGYNGNKPVEIIRRLD